jgi:glycosyl transferase family 1
VRLLLLDVNTGYINPTRNVLPLCLRHAFEVEYFGPGYVSGEALRTGLAPFLDARPAFDFVLATEHVLFSEPWSEATLPVGYRRYHSVQFPLADLTHLFALYEQFTSLAPRRAAVLVASDYYNFSDDQIGRLHRGADVIIGWGGELVSRLGDLPGARADEFVAHANDRWVDFVESHAARVISFPHFVAETEFSLQPLGFRSPAWAVIGAHYAARRAAVARLRAAGISVRYRSPAQLLDGLQRVGVVRRQASWMQGAANLGFRAIVESCRYAYTCGSGLRYPVRKFFEIPALGAVLVCEPCAGFSELGFRNGENAIASAPDQVVSVARALEADPENAQSIASAGRELVWREHSSAARARQLLACLLRVSGGQFRGARWRAGRLELVEDSAPASAIA